MPADGSEATRLGSAEGIAHGAEPSSGPLSGAKAGRLRWAVDSSAWDPEGEHEGPEFQYLLALIQDEEERKQVLKFMFLEDKKRALLSRLLVRRASAAVLGLPGFEALEIARTKGKKPFLKAPRPGADRQDLANFNWNVSHEGDWVVLASEPLCICGVDVAAPQQMRRGARVVDVFKDFADQLTPEEWEFVRREGQRSGTAPGEDPTYEAFQRHWSCKEAFVKARGDGLGFELNRVAFRFAPLEPRASEDEARRAGAYVATAKVDGRDVPLWRFVQHRLGANHWVTVARGPTSDVVDSVGGFRRTMQRPTESFTKEEWEYELEAPSPAFEVVPVAFLVPEASMEGYIRAGGAPWRPPEAKDAG